MLTHYFHHVSFLSEFVCYIHERRIIDKSIVPLRVYKYVYVIRPALLFEIIFLTLNRVTTILLKGVRYNNIIPVAIYYNI